MTDASPTGAGPIVDSGVGTEASSGADLFASQTAASGVKRRTSKDEAASRARTGTAATGIGAGVRWLLLLSVGAAALWPIAGRISAEFNAYMLTQVDDETAREMLVQGLRNPGSADELEILSELSLDLAGVETSEMAARAALTADASRAFVSARLAWLISERAGSLNAQAQDALMQSMVACPLCDEELIRWRFNFVLAHWGDAPDALRRKAFEQADILRWRGQNAAFLAEMRIKAMREGIPFDAYRANVDTPVRSWDLGSEADYGTTPA